MDEKLSPIHTGAILMKEFVEAMGVTQDKEVEGDAIADQLAEIAPLRTA